MLVTPFAYGWQKSDQWQEFSFTEANCALQFPEAPLKKDFPIKIPGSNITAHIIASKLTNVSYSMVYYDIPGILFSSYAPEKWLKLDFEGTTLNPAVKVISTEDYKFNNYPAKKSSFTLNNRLYQRRGFIIDRRIYSLFVETDLNDTESAKAEKFLSSFKLLDKPSLTKSNADWQDFLSVLGNFVVTLPGIPGQRVDQIETRFNSHDINTFLVIGNESDLYIISYQDFTDQQLKQLSTQEIINDARDTFLKLNNGSKVLQENFTRFINFPAKAITMELNRLGEIPLAAISESRFILANNRLYQLVAINNKDSNNRENTEKFFNSFKLYVSENYADDKVFTTAAPGIKNPLVLSKVKPKYTDDARSNKVQGVVVVSAVFRRDGKLTDFKVVKGLGYGLDEEAIEAAGRIKFTPGQLDGQPVSVRARLEYTFSLTDDPNKALDNLEK